MAHFESSLSIRKRQRAKTPSPYSCSSIDKTWENSLCNKHQQSMTLRLKEYFHIFPQTKWDVLLSILTFKMYLQWQPSRKKTDHIGLPWQDCCNNTEKLLTSVSPSLLLPIHSSHIHHKLIKEIFFFFFLMLNFNNCALWTNW